MPDQERIISQQVLGSSNPLARFGRKLSDSISGIFIGILLILFSFALLWWGEQQPEHSKTVAALPLQIESPVTQTGLTKLQAQPAVTQVLIEPKTNTPVLYYHYTKQEFKKVKETRRETRTVLQNGQDVQQTVERDVYIDKWVDVVSDKKWAGFRLSNLNVTPTNAELYVTLTKVFEEEKPVAGVPTDEFSPTKTKEIVEVLPATMQILIVGEAATGSIVGGTPFIISDMSSDALIAEMKVRESRTYWFFKIGAWLLMTIGFTLFFGPIATFLNILPGLGKMLNGLLFIAFGVVSLVIVALGTIAIRYWWLVLIILVALIVLAIAKFKNKPQLV